MICKNKIIEELLLQKEIRFQKMYDQKIGQHLRINLNGMKPEKIMSLIHDLSFVPEGQIFEFKIYKGIMEIPLGQF